MTEIEQLRADLATLKETSKIYLGAYGYFPAHHDLLIKLTKEKIADLEAKQEPADKWADSRMFVQEILADSSFPQRLIWLARYARHLEVNVADLDNELRCERLAGNYDQVEGELKQKIAKLEAQEEPADEWKQARAALFAWEIKNKVLNYVEKQLVLAYVRELQHQVAELDDKLRCERIDGGKVRDDLKARIAEMEQHGRKVDQANHEHYGRLQDQIAIRDLKIEKLERQAPAERNRENLAELTTIANAIPPACGLARELVERWIEGVKREIQNNG